MQDPHPSISPTRREAGVVQRIRASLRSAWRDDAPPHVLIGCSGGRDSVTLVSMLHGLARSGAIRATLVHVDHAVRDDSPLAVQVVQSFGESLGLSVHIETLVPVIVERHPGVGAEEALRRERYAAFSRVMQRTGADVLALAHHERDQAETVLLHLIRGAGLKGASGMREWSNLPVPWWPSQERSASVTVWRPFLRESIATIAEWHRSHDLPLAEDRTNDDRAYRRNAIRHDLLPAMEAILPGAVANLARFADLAAEDDDLLEALAADLSITHPDGTLHRSALVDAPRALGRRVARQWVLGSGYDGELTSDRVDAICELARRNRSGATIDLGAGWVARIDRGALSLAAPKRVP